MFWLIIAAPLLLFIYCFYSIKKIIFYKKPEATLKIIYDGEEFANYTFEDFLYFKKYITCDFILYSIPVEHKKYDNYVVRYERAEDVLEVEYTTLKCLELTDVNITVNDSETYPIDFGRNQYFINGNVLFDRKFLKWYLKMNHKVCLDDDNYKITFRDHEKKFITLPDYCYLLIKINKYIIIKLINK
jgi:hypothetical protein